MARRRSRKFSGPKRPVRWIYSGQWENDNEEETECAVLPVQIPCGFPIAGPGEEFGHEDEFFWHELVRGETDLDWSDKAAPCVTRIVGDASVRAGWNYLQAPALPANIAGYADLPVWLRLGLVVVDEPSGTGWLPPDLWDEEDGDGVRWLWRAQHSFSDGYNATLKWRAIYADTVFGTGFPARGIDRVATNDWNFHMDVRVNATVNRNQSLVMVHSWRVLIPSGALPPGVAVDLLTLANHRVNILHDLRCLVKS